jgi:hypothetical protein
MHIILKDEAFAGKIDKPNPLAANEVDKNSGLAKRQPKVVRST